MRRGCDRCSEMHRKMIEKMMLYLNEKQPEILKQVSAKFDPKGEFMKTFLSKLQRKAANESPEDGQRSGQNKSGNQSSQTQQPKLIKN